MAWYDYFNPVKAPGKLWDAGKSLVGAIDPANPYQAAAETAQQASDMSMGFSQTQWDRQMQGLNQALGYTNPYSTYAQGLAAYNRPGAAETAFQQYGNRYLNDPSSSNVYSNYQRQLQQGGQSATAAAQHQANMLFGGGGPSQSQQALGQVSSMYSRPGQMESFTGQAQQQLGGRGLMEDAYIQNQQRFDVDTPIQQLWRNSAGMFGTGKPTSAALDRSVDQAQQFASGPVNFSRGGLAQGYGQNVFGEAAGGANDRYMAQTKDALSREGAAENYWMTSGQRGFSEDTDFETFARQAMEGSNPYFDRLRAKGQDALNQQMAARGHFTSGGALEALGNYNAEVNAQEARYMGDLLGQAAQTKLGRLSGGTAAAGSTDASRLARNQGLAGLVSQERGDVMKAVGLGADIQSQEESARLGRARLGLDAGKTSADFAMQGADLELRRGQAMASLAQNATASDLAYLQAKMDAAGNAQRLGIDRMQALGSQMRDAQQMELARASGLMTAAGQTDSANADRARLAFQMGQGVDAEERARQGLLLEMANSKDASEVARLAGYRGWAGDAQAQERERTQQVLDALQKQAELQSGLVGGFYQNGGQLSGMSFQDGINAMVNAGQLNAQGGAARWETFWKPFELYAKSRGGGGGAA